MSLLQMSNEWNYLELFHYLLHLKTMSLPNIALVFFLYNDSKPDTNILTAESCSVPEHNSSPKIKLCWSAIFNIMRSSDISTANVDNPLNKLSLPRILVKDHVLTTAKTPNILNLLEKK